MSLFKHLVWGKRPFLNDVLFRRAERKGFVPRHVAEVGVYLPETSNVLGWIRQGIRTTLVEANPDYVKAIAAEFKGYKNLTLIPKAIYDNPGKLYLYHRNSSSFLGEQGSSPAIVNDHYHREEGDRVEVECIRFYEVDDGSIDLLSIDIEGCDWYALKHMLSRPAIISIETHGKKYRNPFYREIYGFMADNSYLLWFKDRSDSVFIRKGLFKISPVEKLWLGFFNIFPRLLY